MALFVLGSGREKTDFHIEIRYRKFQVVYHRIVKCFKVLQSIYEGYSITLTELFFRMLFFVVCTHFFTHDFHNNAFRLNHSGRCY